MNSSSRKAAALFAAMLGGCVIAFGTPDAEESTPTPAPILTTDLSGGDIAFLTGAAPRITLLVQLSALAKKRATTPEVLAEAALAWKEQTAAATRLKAMAAGMSVALPQEPERGAKTLLSTLGKLKGVKFDKSYLDAQADALNALAATVEPATASTNRDIKAYAQSTMDTLQQDQQRLRKLGM